jgi:hypothetical protein
MFRAWLACFLLIRYAGAEPRPVDVVVAGPAERAEPVEKAIQEPLSRLPIEVRLTRASAVDPKSVIDGRDRAAAAFARVWVDLVAENQVTLYFVDAEWERILVRHVPIERGLDDVEREEIAQIVRSAVEALLGGATIGISREQARAELLPSEPEPVPKPAPAPKPDVPAAPALRPAEPAAPPWVAEVGGFYEAEVYAGALWHGPGIVGGVATRDELSPGGRLTLQYRAPMLIEGDRFGARLQALALRALARLAWARTGFVLVASAGAGADLTHVDPRHVSGNVNVEPPSWDVVPVARASGAAGLELSGLRVSSVAGADYDLIETRHVAERSGERYTVFETPRLRPFFGLELTLTIDPNE